MKYFEFSKGFRECNNWVMSERGATRFEFCRPRIHSKTASNSGSGFLHPSKSSPLGSGRDWISEDLGTLRKLAVLDARNTPRGGSEKDPTTSGRAENRGKTEGVIFYKSRGAQFRDHPLAMCNGRQPFHGSSKCLHYTPPNQANPSH